jgi:hypothetical protein
VGFGIPKNRESRKILKFGNPESRKSQSRNFQDSRIPKIPIPKFGIPVQFSGLIPKILKKKFGTFSTIFLDFLLRNQEKSPISGMLIPKMFRNPEIVWDS